MDRANVGRATFYAHYDNKEDLLESGFDGLLTTLRERQREARSHGGTIDERLFAFSHHLLTHADEHRDIFPAMVSTRGGSFIQHLLRNLLVKVVREDVREAAKGAMRPVPEEAMVQFIAGGLSGLIMWWLGGKRHLHHSGSRNGRPNGRRTPADWSRVLRRPRILRRECTRQ